MPVLELIAVNKAFGPVAVETDGSFTLPQGEFLSLLGPSGCGKTTTLSMIAGFENLTSGEIRIRGTRIDQLGPEHRNTGMVFQNYALFPHLNVAQNVAFGPKMRGIGRAERDQRVDKYLTLV
ncbi:MAG: ABC transporter ATP-binding protein, partial [Pseudorhodoplanes sp.]